MIGKIESYDAFEELMYAKTGASIQKKKSTY